MNFWFTENHTENVKFSMKVKEQIYIAESDFQKIAIFDTYEFGKVLTLDGYLMITEKDEFIYHEMIVHVPMATNLSIEKVLVIGAGDGGTIRELVKYKTINQIHMVEIDSLVVEACKKYIPQTTSGLSDPRVEIYYEDGLKYIRKKENYYDLIIVDSTDPFGPGEGLFTKEFYGNCYRALNDRGILVNQHESAYYNEYIDEMNKAYRKIKSSFPIAKIYQAHIPTYPSGHWLFGFASKKYDPIKDLNIKDWTKLNIKTKYYNLDLHLGCFSLPNYVKELIYNDKL